MWPCPLDRPLPHPLHCSFALVRDRSTGPLDSMFVELSCQGCCPLPVPTPEGPWKVYLGATNETTVSPNSPALRFVKRVAPCSGLVYSCAVLYMQYAIRYSGHPACRLSSLAAWM